jgi:aspartyl aminopeptidase
MQFVKNNLTFSFIWLNFINDTPEKYDVVNNIKGLYLLGFWRYLFMNSAWEQATLLTL